jgi:hypothetical protein
VHKREEERDVLRTIGVVFFELDDPSVRGCGRGCRRGMLVELLLGVVAILDLFADPIGAYESRIVARSGRRDESRGGRQGSREGRVGT